MIIYFVIFTCSIIVYTPAHTPPHPSTNISTFVVILSFALVNSTEFVTLFFQNIDIDIVRLACTSRFSDYFAKRISFYFFSKNLNFLVQNNRGETGSQNVCLNEAVTNNKQATPRKYLFLLCTETKQ